jgi:pyruvate,water dikinase
MNRIRLKYEALSTELKEAGHTLEELFLIPETAEVKDEFNSFIMKFGHLSDSGNDFSVSKWEEYPELLFDLIKQSPEVSASLKLVGFNELIGSKAGYKRLSRLYQKAGRYKIYREEISSLYVFGYGLFRYLFLSLGKEFKERGIIASEDDIFYLQKSEIDEIVRGIDVNSKERLDQLVEHRKDEIEGVIDEINPDSTGRPDQLAEQRKAEISGIIDRNNGNSTGRLHHLVEERKADMEASKDIVLPPVIYGDEAPVLEREKIKNIRGVATSSGSFRGRTKIIRGISEFARVNKGDVIVIPFSDISWTPILVKAGAIVSDSGGMLSHCSIIAREMGIPALVSVEDACSLQDDIYVTVDGSNGILTIHDYE